MGWYEGERDIRGQNRRHAEWRRQHRVLSFLGTAAFVASALFIWVLVLYPFTWPLIRAIIGHG